MKTTVKILMTVGLIGTMLSCKSSFNAADTMQVEQNRNAIYKEIITNPVELTNLISEAQKNEEAKKILMKAHMEQMESGNMKVMMEKNPEINEKMESHMQMMLEENPEMMQKMQSKMLAKMMENENGRIMLMDEIHNNEMMKMGMKAKMMQMMNENPEMIEEMMQKMMEVKPEMMEDMMQKMMEKNPEMMKKMKGKMKKP